MKKFYSLAFLFSFVLINIQASVNNFALSARSLGVVDTSKKVTKTSSKISDTRKERPSYLQSGINVEITPFKPSVNKASVTSNTNAPAATAVNTPAKTTQQQDLKIVSNVKVFPNPVAEQLNLTYNVNKDSNVTIKIMDVLGNEIATLLSQKMNAGEQTSSFNINNKLNSGYYFIRLIVGNETIVKRISVL
ncbi:T9SS type A sorting domain-containing protein [Desertivirga arenae]|uniref:T9SS type A sorting domain-containing protein n=1 Tax=Desertivirga arenae TaxID=2810309 RepID=UPI001A9753CD|nr:T9SS type A sorting domain-containing protein [Pedobacter sp. SYSU D00823]